MKLRDLLKEKHKILLGFECCHEFAKELDDDENDEFLDRIERAIGKWLNTEVPEPKGVKPKEGKLQSTYQCPKCDCTVHYLNRYCHYCGAKIKWEVDI